MARWSSIPRRFLLLATWVVATSFVWLVVLPAISREPGMAEHLEWLDARGIDPSATYYTELEAMEPILERLERPRPVDVEQDADESP